MPMTVTPTRKAELLRVQAPGLDARMWSEVELEVENEPYYGANETSLRVVVEFDRATSGFIVTELDVRPLEGGLTTSALREIPLARLRDKAQQLAYVAASDDLPVFSDGLAALLDGGTLTVEKVPRTGRTAPQKVVADVTAPVATRGGRVDDVKLAHVAAVYRRALEAGEPTRRAVRRECGAGSLSTAAKWIMKARERGFLGQTRERKVGER